MDIYELAAIIACVDSGWSLSGFWLVSPADSSWSLSWILAGLSCGFQLVSSWILASLSRGFLECGILRPNAAASCGALSGHLQCLNQCMCKEQGVVAGPEVL